MDGKTDLNLSQSFLFTVLHVGLEDVGGLFVPQESICIKGCIIIIANIS